MSVSTLALWHDSAVGSVLRREVLPELQEGELLLRTLFSLVSQGTERLVACGAVPESLYTSMRVPYMGGDFSFPVKYGYALVGEVLNEGHPWQGRAVFVMHPHQDYCVVAQRDCFCLPANVSPRSAVLAANVETAVTALWDARPLLGERVLVVGFGLLGALTALLLKKIPGVDLWISEPNSYRRDLAGKMGFRLWEGQYVGEFDLCVHSSATEKGLQMALDVLAREGRVLELSWYGNKRSALSLGGAFHHKRLRIISSQVSHLPSDMQARWGYARRKELVFDLLASDVFASLPDGELAFLDLPAFFDELRGGSACDVLGLVVRY